MDDMLSEFLTETNESIDEVDVELVQLEQDPNNPELLANIFRLVHTIKGTCGFLGLPRLEKVAHSGENILGKIRDGVMEVSPEIVTLILEALDQIKVLLAELEANQVEPEGNDLELIQRLDAAADGEPVGAAVAEAAPEPAAEPERELKSGEVSLEELERVFNETAGPIGGDADDTATAEVTPEPEPEPAPVVAEKIPEPAKAVAAEDGKQKTPESSVANSTIRVNVDLLENLMTTVSELVLTRNQLMQLLRVQGNQDSDFAVPLQRLSHVTTDLQEAVMKTRMQPIGNAWAKLPRIIRDLAKDMSKKINLEMIGAETELDRQVLELIKDPLTHMIRNSADHGLEDTPGRIAAGKSETGRVILEAFHEGGHIIVQIRDDGAGINIDRVKEKVLSNGLATEAELEGMTDQQIVRFIFKAGFSTAEKVTSVSGRGVGMDVVRTNIEKIGGTVDVSSVTGKGSTFTIKIPLTLAIVSALIVGCGGERFAMPQISVVELVRASGDSEHRIEKLNDTSVLRLRNRLLPLVNLREILDLERVAVDFEYGGEDNSSTAPKVAQSTGPELVTEDGEEVQAAADQKRDEESFIMVSQVGAYQFGIIVDRVFDTEEIVVKPVSPLLRDIVMFSGNTILGDGSVIMILDPNGIATKIGDTSMADDDDEAEAVASGKASNDNTALLIFRAGNTEPKAVPLALVDRLEDFEVKNVEESNGQMVVQYRGRLMPLINVEGAVGVKESGRQPVLVFTDQDRSMGLIVDDIVDIVESNLSLELESPDVGFIGSAIVSEQATGVLDVPHYLKKAYGDWFGRRSNSSSEVSAKPMDILMLAENQFLRNLMSSYLNGIGFNVTEASSLTEASALKEAGMKYDAVMVDISLDMAGIEVPHVLTEDGNWTDTLFVALTSEASADEIDRAAVSGYSHCVEKGDREAMRDVLSDSLSQGSVAA
jgi:two-component system, chemotaxis family, sensor kinase CheA